MPQRCGNCKYHIYEDYDRKSICISANSEYRGTFTENDEVCEDWQLKPQYGHGG